VLGEDVHAGQHAQHAIECTGVRLDSLHEIVAAFGAMFEHICKAQLGSHVDELRYSEASNYLPELL
jgi:hypothetical protein